MNDEIIGQLVTLGTSLVVAALIWVYYRRKIFALGEKYSTFGPRFWTASVDACVLWPIGFVTSVLLCLDPPRSVAALLVAVESLTWLVYTVVMHARHGQTVGKMITKVRVVDFKTEGNISWKQAWIREGLPVLLSLGLTGYEAMKILDGSVNARATEAGQALTEAKSVLLLNLLPLLWFIAEVLTMLTNEKRRALHDFIAGTVVIRTNIEGKSANSDAAQGTGLPGIPPVSAA